MARFYLHFSNSTVSALEVASAGNRYQRLATTGGAALKTALVNARSALSAAVYAQLNTSSKDGNAGRCIPNDGFSRGGGNLTWSNIYTNALAAWNADLKVRPTVAITVGGSTLFAADAGSITETLYTDAVTALENALANVGMRTHRTPNNFWVMMASLFHDSGLDYIGWDDHTPGTPQTLSLGVATWSGSPAPVTVPFNWATQYPADDECQAWGMIEVVQNTPGIGGGATSYNSGWVNMGSATLGTYNFVTTTMQGSGAIYDVTVTAKFRETTPATSDGAEANILEIAHITFP